MKHTIKYGDRVFTANKITSIVEHDERDVIGASLAVTTFSAVVKSDDPTITEYQEYTPLEYYERDVKRGVFYLQSVERLNKESYKITAVSALEALALAEHRGGIYTGQTVQEVAAEICGTIPFIVKTGLQNIKLYGWLPYAVPPNSSARDNLVQVLFAIGATAKNDLDGVIRIETLWNGMVGNVPADSIYDDASVKTGDKITAVTVLEHSYTAGSEETELFTGTASAGDIITFSAPMHSLTATGFTITQSGANYAVLGSGNGTLTGKKYVHTTRRITRTVQTASRPNEKVIESATLISLFNSADAANRCAEYYKHAETISSGVIFNGARPGSVVGVFSPYDEEFRQAIIQSEDIVCSNVTKANAEFLVGYEPPQADTTARTTAHEVLTGSGTWTVPQGVTNVTAVLIGGGQGGSGGTNGGNGEATVYSQYFEYGEIRVDAGKGGKGGTGGAKGAGGRFYRVDIEVSPGQSFSYSAGAGGAGGRAYAAGGAGGASSFGSYTSAAGETSESGYYDVVTGQTYALPGSDGSSGYDGGDGGELNESAASRGARGGGSGGWGGNGYFLQQPAYSESPYVVTSASGGGGGGGAYGANGANGEDGTALARQSSSLAVSYGGGGGDGATPATPGTPTVYGSGGYGGWGGGGGGGTGAYYYYAGPTGSTIRYMNIGIYRNAGAGGTGGTGGNGAPGCIILIYTIATQKDAGAAVERKSRFRLDKYGRIMVV